MSSLSFDLFVSARDAEAAEYRVLAGLQEARRAFTRTRVYPHLAELIALRRSLADLVEGADRLEDGLPTRVVGVDWDTGSVIQERSDVSGALLALELARWTLPRLDAVIEEGRALFEFVDAHAELASVGLVPRYQAEGFLLLPETTDGGNLATTDALDASLRPRLVVVYEPKAVSVPEPGALALLALAATAAGPALGWRAPRYRRRSGTPSR